MESIESQMHLNGYPFEIQILNVISRKKAAIQAVSGKREHMSTAVYRIIGYIQKPFTRKSDG